MTTSEQKSRAARFRDLNLAGNLLLPNAWDAASAKVIEAAGFPSIGTTSAGVAFARGLRDAELISRDAMIQEIALIASAVEVPVTADIEAGYGPSPADVAATIEATIDAGAVGVNLEDNTHGAGPEPLYGIDAQSERIAAARAVADRRDLPLVINARTDTFILNLYDSFEERLATTIDRGRTYLAAGADLVFIPVLIDPSAVRRAANEIGGPISLMVIPGAPPAADLFAAGAKRVSLGPAAMLTVLGALRTISKDILATGRWDSLSENAYSFGDLNALF